MRTYVKHGYLKYWPKEKEIVFLQHNLQNCTFIISLSILFKDCTCLHCREGEFDPEQFVGQNVPVLIVGMKQVCKQYGFYVSL